MIKFFRKIRQKLLSENKFSKYLFYAIGEIILVVIGILIALQINNWNENRKNIAEEKELLINLLDEFETNLETLKQIKIQHSMILDANSKLLQYTKPDSVTGNQEVIDSLIGITLISPIFNYKDGALNSIISSGKLGLIKNQEMRNKIAQFPGIILDGTRTEIALREIIVQRYLPIIEKNITLRETFRTFGVFRNLDIPISEFNSDYSALFKTKEFENSLVFNHGILNVLMSDYNKFEEELKKIISLLNSEIKVDHD